MPAHLTKVSAAAVKAAKSFHVLESQVINAIQGAIDESVAPKNQEIADLKTEINRLNQAHETKLAELAQQTQSIAAEKKQLEQRIEQLTKAANTKPDDTTERPSGSDQ